MSTVSSSGGFNRQHEKPVYTEKNVLLQFGSATHTHTHICADTAHTWFRFAGSGVKHRLMFSIGHT